MAIFILSSRIDPTSYTQAVSQIIGWAKQGEGRCVYAANVHMLMEAYDSLEFCNIINTADLVTPDGMPLVWTLRLKGHPRQERVYGPTLMLKLLDAAAEQSIPVGFLGSTSEILLELSKRMTANFPGLKIVAQIAPPFRALSAEEDQRIIQQITDSGAKLLFVGLGCPKQEYWIAGHHGSLDVVMVGVGAAFAFHAGVVRQAPPWMQKMGLEWLFRLKQEPQRLFRRYAYTNPRFLFLICRELLLGKDSEKKERLC
jgi:N-acetylglucosaminyldiphosphoundecaprenol N-acetyl-beta-D-mannosaminyltransferase